MSGWRVGPFGVDDDAERQNMEPARPNLEC